MTIHEARFRVRYAETDQMGVVYYANYFIWMEVGRAEYCRAIGIRYKDMELESGVLLAVVEAQCRYRAPARYDDEVTVRTWISRANRRLAEFSYEIRVDEKAVASGSTRHVFLDPGMRPVKLPEKYWEMFGIGGRSTNADIGR
jgi:acyl-CoA thioester hydrolase